MLCAIVCGRRNLHEYLDQRCSLVTFQQGLSTGLRVYAALMQYEDAVRDLCFVDQVGRPEDSGLLLLTESMNVANKGFPGSGVQADSGFIEQ